MLFEVEQAKVMINELVVQNRTSLEKLETLLAYLEADVFTAHGTHGHGIKISTVAQIDPTTDLAIEQDNIPATDNDGTCTDNQTAAVRIEPNVLANTDVSENPAPSTVKHRNLNELELFAQSQAQQNFITKVIAALRNLQEPPRSGTLASIVLSDKFEICVSIVIFLYVCHTVLETNWSLQNGMDISKGPLRFQLATYFFEGAYLLEVLLRLSVHRLYFYVNKDRWWNIFDFGMIVAAMTEYTLERHTYNNPTFLRILRISKAGRKVCRIVRLTRYVTDLKLIVQCVIGSLFSLAWCILMLAGFSLAYAIFFGQQFAAYLSESQSVANTKRTLILSSFGSVQLAVLTLFKCISGGSDWGQEHDIVSSLGAFNSLVFLSYILMVWFSLANIITGVFLQKAMHFAQPEAHTRALAQFKIDLDKARELASLFRMISGQADHVSRDHLEACLYDIQVVSFFEMNELEITDMSAFLDLLTDAEGDGMIHLDTFVGGCLLLKGPARSIDLLAASHRLVKIDGMLRQVLERMQS